MLIKDSLSVLANVCTIVGVIGIWFGLQQIKDKKNDEEIRIMNERMQYDLTILLPQYCEWKGLYFQFDTLHSYDRNLLEHLDIAQDKWNVAINVFYNRNEKKIKIFEQINGLVAEREYAKAKEKIDQTINQIILPELKSVTSETFLLREKIRDKNIK